MQKVASLIKNSRNILIIAGGGIEVDSGLPFFKNDEDLYKVYPIAKQLSLNLKTLSNPSWFDINPKLAWAFYGDRFNLYKNTSPHKGYEVLLNLPNNKFVFTTTISSHFQKAGFSELRVVEVNGSINYLQCSSSCVNEVWENRELIDVDIEKFEAKSYPYCKFCSKIARPNIVMFSDFNFIKKRLKLQLARFEYWLSLIDELLILEIGVEDYKLVKSLRDDLKRRFNAKIVAINPYDSSNADYIIKKDVLDALLELTTYL